MALGEFELISRYFERPTRRAVLGVGDDCALLAPAPGMQLATSVDMLVEGRHFLSTVPADRLGHKSLTVNLSDLAACGAKPIAFTLALSLPAADEKFLEGFARGLFALADRHGCELIGGDTTRGPLTICIGIFGEVPPGMALLRSGAQAGDQLWVSGRLGDARLALEVFRGSLQLPGDQFEQVRPAMELPQPRVELGIALRGIASSAIDVSDGLLGDLGHILHASKVGAVVEADSLPASEVLQLQPTALRHLCTLTGGDDYELLFTAPAAAAEAVRTAAAASGVAVTAIGRIEAASGLRIVDGAGKSIDERHASFDHFRSG
ncbi:thiamine-phosphate kinase [Piscinibacter sakaiensis]|uniref:thiamine-phosphate kinase n=1 Tax=Piscinibacter sakaiensis TaxID=1547922 RepID=UPI003AAE58AE